MQGPAYPCSPQIDTNTPYSQWLANHPDGEYFHTSTTGGLSRSSSSITPGFQSALQLCSLSVQAQPGGVYPSSELNHHNTTCREKTAQCSTFSADTDCPIPTGKLLVPSPPSSPAPTSDPLRAPFKSHYAKTQERNQQVSHIYQPGRSQRNAEFDDPVYYDISSNSDGISSPDEYSS